MSKLHLRFARACWRVGGAAALVAVMLLVLQTPPAGAAAPASDSLNIQTVCFTVNNTGDPLFMAHTSMPQWVQKVVSWLASQGIRPS